MANNKVYTNFLMHGRTKGSRNGISTTKGYTAVGQRAKGKIINGRYVYDYYTPYGAKNSNMTEGYTPLAAISTKEQKRQEQVAKDNAKARQDKMKAENAARVKAMNYAFDKKYGYKEMGKQAASQEWRDKQARETKAHPKIVSKGYTGGEYLANQANAKISSVRNNDWQSIAAARRANTEARQKVSSGVSKSANIPTSAAGFSYYRDNPNISSGTNKGNYTVNLDHQTPDYKKQIAKKNQVEGAARGDAQQAALAQLRKQNQNNVAAKKKAQKAYDSAAKGAANNWQRQAATARDNKETYTKYKEGKINAITAKDNSGDVTTMYHPKDPYGVNYTAIKTEKLGAASKGKKNNWQQAGNLTRSMTEVARDLRNREKANEAAVNKMKSKQPNAMKGDPRYSIQYPKKTLEEMQAAAIRENPAYANAMKLRNQPETFMGKKVTTLALEDAKAESKIRNSRSDIGNAVADFKEEAKAKAKSLFKKKKKK